MELSLPPSPAYLAGLRRAARACLRGMASEAAEDVVLALNEVATNAILYGSTEGSRSRWWSTSTTTWLRRRCWITVRTYRLSPQPMPTPTRWPCVAAGCGYCAGWWMRCGLSASGSGPG